MVEAIAKNSMRVLPAAVWLTGQYGVSDMFIGAPARIGRNGVEEIIEVDLTEDEQKLMDTSAAHVQANLDNLARLGL